MSSTIVNDICSFISWTPQKKIVPLELNAGMCYHVFLLLDCLLIFSSNLSRQSFVIKLIVLSRFFAYLCFQFIMSIIIIIIILLAWMLYIFSIFNTMPIIVTPCLLQWNLPRVEKYIVGMYHKDSNNFFHPLKWNIFEQRLWT